MKILIFDEESLQVKLYHLIIIDWLMSEYYDSYKLSIKSRLEFPTTVAFLFPNLYSGLLLIAIPTKGISRKSMWNSQKQSQCKLFTVSGQLPTRTIPHHTGNGPDEWFDWLVVVLVGSCPRDRGPCGK